MVQNKFKVSQHAKERIFQRTDLNRGKDANSLFRNAVHSGKSPSQFSPPFSTYLKNKLKRGNQVKVYAGMIFIYSGKTLITAYRIPPKFKELLKQSEKLRSAKKLANSMSNKVLLHSVVDCCRKWQHLALLSKSGMLLYSDKMCVELVSLGERTKIFSKTICSRYQVDFTKSNKKVNYLFVDAYLNYVATELSKLNVKKMQQRELQYLISVLNTIMKYIDKHNNLLNSKSV